MIIYTTCVLYSLYARGKYITILLLCYMNIMQYYYILLSTCYAYTVHNVYQLKVRLHK